MVIRVVLRESFICPGRRSFAVPVAVCEQAADIVAEVRVAFPQAEPGPYPARGAVVAAASAVQQERDVLAVVPRGVEAAVSGRPSCAALALKYGSNPRSSHAVGPPSRAVAASVLPRPPR